MPTLAIDVDEEVYDAFWDMKNDLCPEGGTSLNHDEALAYLIALHDRYGLRLVNPREKTWREDVACSDCGVYEALIGPIDLDGRLVWIGDMVCWECATERGLDLADLGGRDGGR